MAEVAFLDGPLRGRTQTVPGDQPRPSLDVCHVEPREVVYAADEPKGLAFDIERKVLTYRVFRSPYLAGPRWVAAMGERVGQTVLCVVPFTDYAARNLAASIDEILSELATERLRQMCVAEGLVAVEIRERWRGTLAEAKTAAHPYAEGGPNPLAQAAEQLGGYVGDPDMRLSLWQAIAAVPAADVQEVRR
ncbi:hypothetical protein FGG44_gp88 [Mycobacterium phage MacnCheese]|uniref:Uncharacterized protein n=1 Tax=Mycobacterium phage MacnCheese TaxID=2927982 RepID=I6XD58_9CAUD|nr:hypothetical protein FGG44_gp88 [Mycobacterium phage MacnCheese]AFN37776.1 hypothetical protein MACNCHEESE_88 [Mycobacterium phage MacnCheese]